MMKTYRNNLRGPRRMQGFSMLELLIAMFILAIGMVSIASVFPVAASIQRQTYVKEIGDQFKKNVAAMIDMRGFAEADFNSTRSNYRKVHPVPDAVLEGDEGSPPNIAWPLEMRAYPTFDLLNPYDDPTITGDDAYTEREFYWVPLVRDTSPTAGSPSYELYVFLLNHTLRSTEGAKYPAKDNSYANFTGNRPDPEDETDPPRVPGVRQIDASNASTIDGDFFQGKIQVRINDFVFSPEHDIQPGDTILGSDGIAYKVVDTETSGSRLNLWVDGFVNAEIDAIWYAVPSEPERTNPTVDILIFGEDAFN